jgi:hypothetical protein
VRSRNYRNFVKIAETALVEESVIVCKQDRYKSEGGGEHLVECSSCGKVGHVSSKCYAQEKKEAGVNPVTVKGTDNS